MHVTNTHCWKHRGLSPPHAKRSKVATDSWTPFSSCGRLYVLSPKSGSTRWGPPRTAGVTSHRFVSLYFLPQNSHSRSPELPGKKSNHPSRKAVCGGPWPSPEGEEELSLALRPSGMCYHCPGPSGPDKRPLNSSKWPQLMPRRAEESPSWALPDDSMEPCDLTADYCFRSLMLTVVCYSAIITQNNLWLSGNDRSTSLSCPGIRTRVPSFVLHWWTQNSGGSVGQDFPHCRPFYAQLCVRKRGG